MTQAPTQAHAHAVESAPTPARPRDHAADAGAAGSSAPAERAQSAWYERLLDAGLIPDALLRPAIRRRLRERIAHESRGGEAAVRARFEALLARLREAPVAVHTDRANEQHYELPPEFFRLCLGPRLKYSGALWEPECRTLGEAEEAMLALSCARAEVRDGQRILELGCGWGSLTLWMAQQYPNATITAVSNSRPQREFILAEAARRGVRPPTVITADMREYRPQGPFDRVVSVEMFEHMKNYRDLLARIAAAMAPDARLFVHIFTHTRLAYEFEGDDWIGRYFFTGGIMPSDDLLTHFQDDLALDERWRVDGTHYARTARAWLHNLDARRGEALRVLAANYGPREAPRWLHRWRTFFIACEELWGLDHGSQWIVSHYRFRKR